jgi:phage shock protein PspC (stress-responsive transcriptional regulator)/predicted membrane protein
MKRTLGSMNVDDDAIPAPPPPPPPPPPRRLTRSSEDKVLTGLCGGLGRALGVDPVVFRIAFVVLALAGGTGVLLYLVGWLLVPDDQGVTEADRMLGERSHNVALLVLAAVAILLVLDRIGDHRGRGDFPLALVLIGIGALVLWSRQNRQDGGRPATPGQVPPTPGGPASDTAAPPSDAAATLPGADDAATPPADSATTPPGDRVPPPADAAAPPQPGDRASSVPPTPSPGAPVRPARPPSALVPATLSLLLVLAGVLALLGVSLVTGLAVALLATGIALVIGAWRGRARGLIPVALLLTVALATVSWIDVPLAGGVGDRTYRPVLVEQLRSPYRIGVGELTLDLSQLELDGRRAEVLVTAGIGRVEVLVPTSVQLTLAGHAGIGEVVLLGSHWGGSGIDQRVVQSGLGLEGEGRLSVRARVGIGQVEVRRAAA